MYNRNQYVQLQENWQQNPPAQAGVAVFDVNGLKELNELYGHHYGDQVLVEVARILKLQACTDQLFRLGGDEFIAVYEKITHADFQQSLARLKKAFTLILNGVSLGGSWSEDEADINSLLSHANQLMIIAKQNYYKTTETVTKHYHPQSLQRLKKLSKKIVSLSISSRRRILKAGGFWAAKL